MLLYILIEMRKFDKLSKGVIYVIKNIGGGFSIEYLLFHCNGISRVSHRFGACVKIRKKK